MAILEPFGEDGTPDALSRCIIIPLWSPSKAGRVSAWVQDHLVVEGNGGKDVKQNGRRKTQAINHVWIPHPDPSLTGVPFSSVAHIVSVVGLPEPPER